MRFFFMLFLFVRVSAAVEAQTIPVFTEKNSIKNTTKKAGNAGPAAVKNNKKRKPAISANNNEKTDPSRNVSPVTSLQIVVNADCNISIDGRSVGLASQEKPAALSNISPGVHQVVCKNGEGDELLQREINIPPGEQTILTLDLLTAKNEKTKKKNVWLIEELEKGEDANAEKIREAVYEGANINVRLSKYASPVIWALELKKNELLQFFVNKGVDVNTVSYDGRTALVIAMQQGLYDIAKLLVSKGAIVKRGKNAANDPVYLAVRNDEAAIVSLMNDKTIDWNIIPSEDKSLLQIAIDNGSVNMAGILIDKGANPNYESQLNGMLVTEELVPLAYALKTKYSTEMLGLLISKGAEINRLYYDRHCSPMHVAARRNEPGPLEFFINNGGNINLADYAGQTPLYSAANSNALKTAQLLLKRNAKPGIGLNNSNLSHDMKKLLRSYGIN